MNIGEDDTKRSTDERRAPYAVLEGVAAGPDEVISLYEVAKRIGLHGRSRSNWTPLLLMLCRRAMPMVDVRHDGRVPCCRESDVPRIAALVERHFDRPRYSRQAAPRRPKNTPSSRA